MAKTKTTKTGENVSDFLQRMPDNRKLDDSLKLINIFRSVTGLEPYMWGPSIIGFGNYHYKYASGHEGDAPLVGFSPRKSAFSLYIGCDDRMDESIAALGKCRAAKSCIYFKKLDDINIPVLEQMIRKSIILTNKKYPPQD